MAKHWSTKPLNQGWPSSMFILCFQFSNAPTFSLRARLTVNVADEEGQEAVKLLLGLGAALSRISKSWGQTARQPPSPSCEKMLTSKPMAEHHPKKQAGESRRGVDKHSVDVSEKNPDVHGQKKPHHDFQWLKQCHLHPCAPSPVTVSDQYWSIVLWSSQGLP